MSTIGTNVKTRGGATASTSGQTMPVRDRVIIAPVGEPDTGSSPDDYGSLPIDSSELNVKPTGSNLWLLLGLAVGGWFLFGKKTKKRR